jgi:DNA-binding response OmpR family regulator
LKQVKLLYLEDDKIMQENMEFFLKDFFSEIHIVSNGNEALEKYKEVEPEFLILDINTPGITGIEFAQEIRKENKDIPIIFISAYSDKPKLLSAIDLKSFGYFIKPFKVQDLREKIENVIRGLDSETMIYLGFDYSWDKEIEELFHNSSKVKTTDKEKHIISALVQNKPNILNAKEISLYMAPKDGTNEEHNIKKVISRLKNKLKEQTGNPNFFIKTIYNKGYQIVEE